LERECFAALLTDGAQLFTEGHKNLLTGAESRFGFDGLDAAFTLFRQQRGMDGELIMVRPELILVPPALEIPALRLLSMGTVDGNPLGANTLYQNFPVESTNALLEACNNASQRLIIVLARYGGLRCPSELAGLRWSEVNWDKRRFIVHSPKTERHKGGAYRTVPLFPEVEKAMSELWDTLPAGTEDRIFPDITWKKSLGSFIAKTAKRAGIVLWEKPFQNMRSSRATELVAIYPAHVVNAIMGHTEAVAMAHYRQVLDSDFEKMSALVTDKNEGQDSVKEPAILGLNRLETENSEFAVTSTVATPCNENQGVAKVPPNYPYYPARTRT